MAQPWFDHYDEDVPHAIGSYPPKTLLDFVAEHARTSPDATALRFKGRGLTFREVDEASTALARSLTADGVGRGDRVALLLPNCPQFVIAELAVWKAGGIVVPQNPIYTDRELEESLAMSAPETLIVLSPFYERIRRIRPRTALRRVIVTNVKEYLPTALRILFTLFKEKKEGHRVTLDSGDQWLEDWIARGSSGRSADAAFVARPEDLAFILMSGGTTGTPKGVMVSHRDLVVMATQIGAWLHASLAGRNASVLLPLPLFHIYGIGTHTIALVRAIPLILVPNPRDIEDLLATIHRERPTLMSGVPTLYTAMLVHPKVAEGRIDFSSLQACFSGAAALMAETKRRFETVTGSRIVEGYSLTEAAMACCANPLQGTSKIGSVGMPLPDVGVQIVDAETGTREVAVGEVGEIVMLAPQLMRGYWNNAEETARTLRSLPDGSTGLFTGDLGYLDEDGYLFLVDRKKDLIKASGLQVWPREVEEVIATHPDVAEVGVAGLPDERRGEIVAAWVVPRPGASIDPAALRDYCRERLAPFKVPTRVEIREALPKTMVGKVLRRALVAEAKAAG